MISLSMVMFLVSLLGVLTVAVCILGMIRDNRKRQEKYRENRRKNASENTVKAILAYNARQQREAMYYRHRA